MKLRHLFLRFSHHPRSTNSTDLSHSLIDSFIIIVSSHEWRWECSSCIRNSSSDQLIPCFSTPPTNRGTDQRGTESLRIKNILPTRSYRINIDPSTLTTQLKYNFGLHLRSVTIYGTRFGEAFNSAVKNRIPVFPTFVSSFKQASFNPFGRLSNRINHHGPFGIQEKAPLPK